MTILLADAGGTNIRMAWTDDGTTVKGASISSANQYKNLTDALRTKCESDRIKPDAAVIAIAGRVIADTVSFTNRNWTFSQSNLKSELDLNELLVINDFAAVALSLPTWKTGEIDYIKRGTDLANSPMLAMGPGTGLGIAAIIPNGDSWTPLAGEGGHCLASFSGLIPQITQERLRKNGLNTWEDVLSGSGLHNLHSALHDPKHKWSPEQIVESAANGESDSIATLQLFAALLGRRAADATLLFGAWGGVYITGGVIQALDKQFDRAAFTEAFLEHKDGFLEDVPIGLLTAEYPAFSGLAYAARMHLLA